VGLERAPLSLVSTTEELLDRKSSGSSLEIRSYGRRDPSRWPRGTLYPQKLVLTSPRSSSRSVGVILSWTQATEFSVCVGMIHTSVCGHDYPSGTWQSLLQEMQSKLDLRRLVVLVVYSRAGGCYRCLSAGFKLPNLQMSVLIPQFGGDNLQFVLQDHEKGTCTVITRNLHYWMKVSAMNIL
jgi:hypothetical protein